MNSYDGEVIHSTKNKAKSSGFRQTMQTPTNASRILLKEEGWYNMAELMLRLFFSEKLQSIVHTAYL